MLNNINIKGTTKLVPFNEKGEIMQGLIIENISNLYKVQVDNNIYETTPRGKLKKDEIIPVVGDDVEISVVDEENKKAVIEEVINRKVYIKRPKLANLTQLLFVVSSKDPKPDLLLLDKQLAFAEYLGIKAVIVLNKTDLDDEEEFKNIQKIYTKIGYTVLQTEAKNKKGIDELRKILKNNINAFSGNSGVGKSTLINAIFNKEMTEEGEISAKNKRGKNTTTAIKLYKIEENTYIADTPGFSTFDISEVGSNNLDKYFIDFNESIKNCKFVGCTHIKEECCGIKQSVIEENIDKGRYDRFCKIYNELKEGENKKW